MLAGKRALITGSSQGIGLAVGRAFAAAGASVMLTSEHPASACRDLNAVLAEHPTIRYRAANMLHEGEAERVVNEAWETLGGLDVLVNNVGTFREPSFLDLSRSDFDRIFHLNVWAAIAATKAFVKLARSAQRGGRILFSTSLNGSRSEPQHTLYDASKGAVNALTRQLAIELAPQGFTTAAIAPGLVETPLTDFGLRSDPASRQAILEQIPVRRIATVDDLAPWFVFLASDAASYSTGSIVIVDGGLDAQQMAFRPVIEAEKG